VDLNSVGVLFEEGPFSGPIRDGILSQEAAIAIVWRIFDLNGLPVSFSFYENSGAKF